MKWLFDQNISHRLLPLISDKFKDIHHVKGLGLIDTNDHDIFMFARIKEYDAIVTIDDDFVRLLNLFSVPPKIIWIQTGNCSTSILAEIFLSKIESITEFVDSDFSLYEVLKQA
jgi:predicted nuclease of predicted toxin-antitoxin system